MSTRPDSYRPEIDGLRAIAILAVLFYHTAVTGFSGGFVGVDIFFVISGFLITSIVMRDIASRTFSFRSFYERRIRRLFPALLTVVLCSAIAAVVLLSPGDLEFLGKSIFSVGCFASNLFYIRHSDNGGYFGSASGSQVLLHTWTLSVEEQFYLLFPMLLLLTSRLTRRLFIAFLVFLAVTSLLFSESNLQLRPVTAFYDLRSRAWELLLGAMLSLQIIPALRWRPGAELVAILGLGAIVFSIVAFSNGMSFPGLSALLPCVGTAMVIHATAGAGSSIRTLLGTRPLAFIGLISYSLYLWHWPIVAFAHVERAGELTPGETALVILASLAIASLSLKFIESPFRSGSAHISRTKVFAFGMATIGSCAIVGLVFFLGHGIPARFDIQTRGLIEANTERKSEYREDQCSNWKRKIGSVNDIQFCNLGGAAFSHKIMFWGDSQVQQLFPVVKDLFDQGSFRGRGVVIALSEGCTPAEQLNRSDPGFHCDEFSRFAFQRAERADIEAVYIGFAVPPVWGICPSLNSHCVGRLSDEEVASRVIQELSEHIRALKALGKRVIVSLPFPMYDKSIPDVQIRNAILRDVLPALVAKDITLPDMRSRMLAVALENGALIFDPHDGLCRDGSCISQMDGISIYKDALHIVSSQARIVEADLATSVGSALP